MIASVSLKSVDLRIMNMRTRFPFRFGISEMVALPHLFVTSTVEVNGKVATGVSSEHLPPKWFTKDPDTSFASDIDDMLVIIRHAVDAGLDQPPASSFFEFWRRLYQDQAQWALVENFPPLLANLGTSLVERSVLDALCRSLETTIDRFLLAGSGIELGAIRSELESVRLDEVISSPIPKTIALRHTIGMADPLRNADVATEDRVDDGLPHTFEDCIRTYGLTHFKIKVCGNVDEDVPRLKGIWDVIRSNVSGTPVCTLDGNEQYSTLDTFREQLEVWQRDPEIADMLAHVAFFEQPLKRAIALSPEVKGALDSWPDHPPMIIDESDGTLGSLDTALSLGYVGTSHKNCKGIVKGLHNAALLKARSRSTGRSMVLSGEDLTNVGPVSLLQDLAIMGALGIGHVERNGHHYFKGLSALPEAMQQHLLEAHPDLYAVEERDYPSMAIKNGHISLASISAAPFGSVPLTETETFSPASDWSFSSLGL